MPQNLVVVFAQAGIENDGITHWMPAPRFHGDRLCGRDGELRSKSLKLCPMHESDLGFPRMRGGSWLLRKTSHP